MLVLNQASRGNVPPMASYFQDINESPLLTMDDEHDLAWRVEDGDAEARDQMVKSNLRLVVSIARGYVGRGLCLSDLIQEGNLGLVHAVERFDPSRNTRFSTYAKYWIQEAMRSALEEMAGPVRVPAYVNELMTKWRKTTADLHKELGRIPSDEEVAGSLQLSSRQFAIVKKAQRIHGGISHLDSQNESGTRANELVDPHSQGPDASMTANEEMQQVLAQLDKLPHREATVLRLRFGLGGNDPMTLNEIGQKLNLTRERVRQVEKDALTHLREFIEAA